MEHGMAGSAIKLTYEDFVHFPDDGKRHEIIDGEHFVTASPATRHQAIARNLTGLLYGFLRGRATSGRSIPHRSTSCCHRTMSSRPIC
jgi:hypothetical protein